MRLLPKTPRGTWLLAALLWAAASAVLWHWLPVLPRVTHSVPAGTRLAAVDATGTYAVLVGHRQITSNSGHGVGPARLLNLTTSQIDRELLDADTPILGITFAADGRRMGVHQSQGAVNDSATVRIFDPRFGREFAPFHVPPHFNCFNFVGDGRTLVCEDATDARARVLRFWDYVDGKEMDHALNVGTSYAFSPDGSRLAFQSAASTDEKALEIVVWDAVARRRVRAWSVPRQADGFETFRLCFSQCGRVLVASFAKHNTRIVEGHPFVAWDVDTGVALAQWNLVEPVAVTPGADAVIGMRYVPDDSDYTVGCWDFATGAERYALVRGWPRGIHYDDLGAWFGGNLLVRTTGYDDPVAALGRTVGRWSGIRRLGTGLPRKCLAFYDAGSGEFLGDVSLSFDTSHFPAGRRALISLEKDSNTLSLWDVPPLKSLKWFAVGMALLAVPVSLIARRRARRLRRETVV
jgi:WD40 repeat protein